MVTMNASRHRPLLTNRRALDSLAGFPSLRLVTTPRRLRLLAMATFILLLVTVIGLLFVPWQQSVIGKGQVWVYSPMERPQAIEATLSGRIERWLVLEGQHVKKGQVLGELIDIDKAFLSPRQLEQYEAQRAALQAKLEAAEQQVAVNAQQVVSLEQAQSGAVPSTRVRQQQATNRLEAARQNVVAAEQAVTTSELNLKRLRTLFEEGLRSKRDLELAELDIVSKQTSLEQSRQQLDIARQETDVAALETVRVAGDTQAKIADALAKQAKAQETVASTLESLQKLDVEIEALKNRMDQRHIVAPTEGTLVRLLPVGRGETVKEGTQLALVVPDTTDQAVELYVTDFDAPLVNLGAPVRLQFAGWPALQFSGWPSVAVGTFGGVVTVVDAVRDEEKGGYRVVVQPDYAAIAKGMDEPWPSSQFLRPGTEATGWIMLNTVALGFELWRQFNAFPPSLSPEQLDKALNRGPQLPKLDKALEQVKRPKAK